MSPTRHRQGWGFLLLRWAWMRLLASAWLHSRWIHTRVHFYPQTTSKRIFPKIRHISHKPTRSRAPAPRRGYVRSQRVARVEHLFPRGVDDDSQGGHLRIRGLFSSRALATLSRSTANLSLGSTPSSGRGRRVEPNPYRGMVPAVWGIELSLSPTPVRRCWSPSRTIDFSSSVRNEWLVFALAGSAAEGPVELRTVRSITYVTAGSCATDSPKLSSGVLDGTLQGRPRQRSLPPAASPGERGNG